MEAPPLGSTYRLQLHGIGFAGARQLVGYLADLGVQTLYVSPIFAAVPGSTHGYDVIDPTRLDPALGTETELELLLGELNDHHMRLLIDIVPNHMAAHPANRWWWDVLRNGPASECAPCFDIDWSQHDGRVLIPTLSSPLQDLTATARVVRHDGELILRLDGQTFPLRPGTAAARGVDAALRRQHYRPAYWRLGQLEGNYRRFFDIDGLVGVRVEDPAVFERTHAGVIGLNHDDRIAGWRVDHVDGLADPARYLERFRSVLRTGRRTRPVVLVEKIVARGETLPQDWATDGTTGYEFADLLGGLFVNAEGAQALEQLGHDITGSAASFADLAEQGKREVVAHSFSAPLDRLAKEAMAALDEQQPGHDLALGTVRQAVAELAVGLDVYRTYRTGAPIASADAWRLKEAATRARAAAISPETVRAITALTEGLQNATGPWQEVAQRWQQLTGAVMAKGVEDTATYRYPGLLGHAEVGCDPAHAAATPAQFHALARRRTHPGALNATSTHDSKRSEDARARLFAISEVPEEWSRLVRRWHGRRPTTVPNGHDELLTYQTLAAVWPFQLPFPVPLIRRVQDYLVKAAREAKRRTSWADPDQRYEGALTTLAGRLVRDPRFSREMTIFMSRIGPAAATNSLAMVVLKTMCRGVPDFYQGTEVWDFSLTDPDNRRPVDFAARARMLAELPPLEGTPGDAAKASRDLLRHWQDGRIKLQVTRALLNLRKNSPTLFHQGSYHVLQASGPMADHVVVVGRRSGRQWVIALIPRQTMHVSDPRRFAVGPSTWSTSTIALPHSAPTVFTDVVSGATVRARGTRLLLADCFEHLPIAVLTNRAESATSASR